MDKHIPINKGNYSMDSPAREELFEKYKGEGWEQGYQEYRKNWVEFAKKKHVSEYPLLVDLELASACNLRCPMCYTISPGFKEKVNVSLMDFDLFKKIIDEIGGKVPALRLSLRGEATLHSKFVQCIEYAKQHGIKEVSSLTHGGKLTRDFFHQIAKAGIDWITITSFISPYRIHRDHARAVHQAAGLDYFEVYIDAPLAVCESRDPKGLYKRARAGELKGMTGVDDPYEVPAKPDLVVKTAEIRPAEAAQMVIGLLEQRGILQRKGSA
jgi:hypothetical protein